MAKMLIAYATSTITSISDITNTLSLWDNWLFTIFWILAVATLVWGATLFLTAGDNEDKIKTAKKIIMYTVIAAAIVLLATGLPSIVSNLLQGQ
jgi:hypothetical protein